MTIEEVMKEMRGHLNERGALQDNLVLTATWRHLVDPDMPCDMFKRRVRAQPGGKQLWDEYTKTVRERREAFRAALRQAVVERRPVYTVAELWGVKISSEYLRECNIKPWGHTLDVEWLRQLGHPGMTIRGLAKATGYNPMTLYQWIQKGKLKEVYRLVREPLSIGIGFKWVIAEVLRAK